MAANRAQLQFTQISHGSDAEKALSAEALATLEQERDAHQRRVQDLEHRLDGYSQRAHGTNVEARGIQQSVQKMQADITPNEATVTAH
eukprot:2100189-Pyramimonas_sp.AAC.1